MDNIENIGLYLKQIREEHKIPIAQVAQALRTKLETIQALEANDFQKIPAPTYVKGYLRSYANYLEIDSEQVLAAYNKQYPIGSKQVLILQGQKFPRVGLDIRRILRSKLFISTGIIILFIAVTTLFIFLRPKKKFAPNKEIGIQTSAPKAPEIIPSPPVITAPIATPMFLVAHTLNTVWLRVQSDGKLIFEGTLQKGEEENWQAQNEFKLRIGNPSNLNLSLNSQSIGTISPYGPVNVTINEKGIKIEK